MPMDFREYLFLIDKKDDVEVEEDSVWREHPPYNNVDVNSVMDRRTGVDNNNERSVSSQQGVRMPSRGRQRSSEDSDCNCSKSLPLSASDFRDVNGCLDLYGQSPPPPTLNSSPWDRFTAVTSPTKLIKAPFPVSNVQQNSGNIFFDLWGDDEDVSPPSSPFLQERPPHLSRLKSHSCPPHWPVRKDTGLDQNDGPRRQAVSFADDYGLPLTSVRFFTESIHDPPKFLFKRRGTCFAPLDKNDTSSSAVINGGNSEAANFNHTVVSPAHADHYLEPEFEQPIADFVSFMKKLDANNVCLENVALKDHSDVIGTVKVKNVGFEKSVTIRLTFNQWESYCDVPAWFNKNDAGGPPKIKMAYDTFSFRTKIPLGVDNLQFAVKYRVNGNEYWDSNGGENYRMLRKL